MHFGARRMAELVLQTGKKKHFHPNENPIEITTEHPSTHLILCISFRYVINRCPTLGKKLCHVDTATLTPIASMMVPFFVLETIIKERFHAWYYPFYRCWVYVTKWTLWGFFHYYHYVDSIILTAPLIKKIAFTMFFLMLYFGSHPLRCIICFFFP